MRKTEKNVDRKMTKNKSMILAIVLILSAGHAAYGRGAVDTAKSPHVKLKTLSTTDVKWTDGFWADRFDLCRKSMLPTLHSTLLDPKCSAKLNRIKFTAGLYEKNPPA